MFTGIVEELGTVQSIDLNAGGARVVVAAVATLTDLEVGGSVAVDGCCLTAVEVGDGWFAADAVTETLARSALGSLRVGDRVNLERPVRADGRLDGHIVQGHVDATGILERRQASPDGSFLVRIGAPPDVSKYLVEKGSVAVDGVSLTVVAVDAEGFTVAVIPHTAAVTTLGHKPDGSAVNLEVELLAKYVVTTVERLQGS